MTIHYDRISKYRQTDPLRIEQFTDIYCEAFNDPSGAYVEQNTTESTIRDVWKPSIEHGRVALAFDDDKVIGLACVEPIELASDEEKEYAELVFRHLETTMHLHRCGYPVWYFSELAVREAFTFLDDFIQHSENSVQVLEHGGHSFDKIWGYQIVNPLSW